MRNPKPNRRIALILALIISIALFAPLVNAALPALALMMAESVTPLVVHAVGRAATMAVGVAANDASFASAFATFNALRRAIGLVEIAVAADRLLQVQIAPEEPVDRGPTAMGIYWDVSTQVAGWNGRTPRLNGYASSRQQAMDDAVTAIRSIIAYNFPCTTRIQEPMGKTMTRGNMIQCGNGVRVNSNGESTTSDNYFVDIKSTADGGPISGYMPDGKVPLIKHSGGWTIDNNEPDLDFGPSHLPLLGVDVLTTYRGLTDGPTPDFGPAYPPDYKPGTTGVPYYYPSPNGPVPYYCCIDPYVGFVEGEFGEVNTPALVRMPVINPFDNQPYAFVEFASFPGSVYIRASQPVSATRTALKQLRTNSKYVPVEFADMEVIGNPMQLPQLDPYYKQEPSPAANSGQTGNPQFPSDYVRDITARAIKTALTAIGSTQRYRVDVCQGGQTRRVLRDIQRSYDPKYFDLYQSYSGRKEGDAQAVEENIDQRGNILKGALFKFVLPVGLVVLIFAVMTVKSFFTPKDAPKPETAKAEQKKATPAKHARETEETDKWRVVGWIGFDPMRVVVTNGNRTRIIQPPNWKMTGLTIETFMPNGEAVTPWSGPVHQSGIIDKAAGQ